MRTAYREHISNFTHDLQVMADYVRGMMTTASEALLNVDLQKSEQVLSSIDTVEDLRIKCEKRAFELLALEAPVARDLRQVVSGSYIVEELSRMGALAVHVANVARRRHPEPALPDELRGFFTEMSRLAIETAQKIYHILTTYDVDTALQLAQDDEAIDDIHRHIFILTTQRPWNHSTTSAVDAVLLSRYFERYADHAVNIGDRMVYLATGKRPNDFAELDTLEHNSEAVRSRFDEIRRRYESPDFGDVGSI